MGHALRRLKGHVVARPDDLALCDADRMALDNLLREGLRGLGCLQEGAEEVGCRALLQRVEDIRGVKTGSRRAESAWGEVETG